MALLAKPSRPSRLLCAVLLSSSLMLAVAVRAQDVKPALSPILTKRGADVLMHVEKLLDDAAQTAGIAPSPDPAKPAKPVSSTSLPFPESFAAAAPGDPAKSAPRKN